MNNHEEQHLRLNKVRKKIIASVKLHSIIANSHNQCHRDR